MAAERSTHADTSPSVLLTRLLTVLNTSALRPSALKRRKLEHNDWHAIARRVSLQESSLRDDEPLNSHKPAPEVADAADETEDLSDGYSQHFAAGTPFITDASIEAATGHLWQTAPGSSALGRTAVTTLLGGSMPDIKSSKPVAKLVSRLKDANKDALSSQQTAFLDQLSTYRDVLHSHSIIGPEHERLMGATSVHLMSHLAKGQRRILSDNASLAKAKTDRTELDSSIEVRDQGFTRPKVLLLLPFRNSALNWVGHLSRVAQSVQVENVARFRDEFTLPDGIEDKLANPDAANRYPADHIRTFRGNIDDAFRVGIKATRKSLRLFSEFYGSDIILASPLGLRKSIDESGDSDFLSSIEIVVVDQLDTMLMQNWDHVKFVFDRLNQLPESPRDTDYSRVKPWYLDGRAAYLRQTVLFSAFETPEIRALFSRALFNVAGRVQFSTSQEGCLHLVHRGVNQTFTRFDAIDPASEEDARFEAFTTKTLPMLLKSAVMSSHTLIFVPSYFDFVRLREHMKGLTDFSFAAISEYSAGSDVARARTYFQNGRKAFLVLTERFHFFRRFRIRGAKTIVFYGVPDHAIYYSELINASFIGNDAPDESEISVHSIFSRFDALRLARLVGDQDAKRMCHEQNGSRFTFA